MRLLAIRLRTRRVSLTAAWRISAWENEGARLRSHRTYKKRRDSLSLAVALDTCWLVSPHRAGPAEW